VRSTEYLISFPGVGLLVALNWAFASGRQTGAAESLDASIAAGGGIKVYVKVDFDVGPNPFAAQGSGAVDLETRKGYVIAGRSLHIKRANPSGYFGARMPVAVKGSTNVKIAFCVRSKGMNKLAVNFFDEIRRDNTTPASPARRVVIPPRGRVCDTMTPARQGGRLNGTRDARGCSLAAALARRVVMPPRGACVIR